MGISVLTNTFTSIWFPRKCPSEIHLTYMYLLNKSSDLGTIGIQNVVLQFLWSVNKKPYGEHFSFPIHEQFPTVIHLDAREYILI